VSLVVAVACVFGLAAVTPLLTRAFDRNAGYLGAAVFGGLAVVLTSSAPDVFDGRPLADTVAWLPSVGVSLALRMDALGLLFAVIVLGIGAAVLAYSARYFPHGSEKTSRYLTLLTFFAGSMLGLVLADDVIMLFVFWELTSVSSFFLIGGLGEGKPGATRAFLVTGLGGLALLAGLILMGVEAGTSSVSTILADPALVTGSPLVSAMVVLLVLGAATKSAQLPFHFWLPGAMVAPTPVSTYLHAATMVKAGIYLLFRFTVVFADVPLWRVTLVVLGLATALFGAVVATKQHDLKGLLAYSTVSQLGFLTGLIGIGTPLALAAAALHTLAHAMYKAALFMTVGIIDHETGTRDLRRLGGLRRALPLTAAAGGLAAVSMAGLPPLVGFVSKEEAFAAFLEAPDPAWLAPFAVVLAVGASIGTFAYSARYYLGTFEGPERTPAHAAPAGFAMPAAVLAAAGLLAGLVVPWLDPLVNGVAAVTTGTDPDLHLALWHGLTVPLLLSAIVIGVGSLLVWRRTDVERLQDRTLLPTGEAAFDRTYDATLALGKRFGAPAAFLSPSAYLLPILATLLLVGVAAVSFGDLSVPAEPAPSLPTDWAVVLLLAACIAGVVQARSRLGAIAALGMTGFVVAGWFVLLGAPDLALTQLLVETLTIAVVVVVFRRLPETFPRGGKLRKSAAGLIAAAVGLSAGVGAYLFTGRRGLSEIGERFLAEGESVTGGSNVVNTILVDFRALDTLGEMTVLGVATLGIYALVRLVRHDPIPRPEPTIEVEPDEPHEVFVGDARADDDRRGEAAAEALVRRQLWRGPGTIDSLILQTVANALGTAMVIASLWLLVRGHNAVGGGFIGGLAGGAAVVLFYLSHGHERVWQSRWLRITPLIGVGMMVGTGYGLWGLAFGDGFLAGGKVVLPFGISVAASLVFDIGVYLVVVGMIVAIVRHLGQGLPEDAAAPPRTDPAAASTPDGTVSSEVAASPDAGGRP
jgi:multicomponent Na+:H+ antiporter subunit A